MLEYNHIPVMFEECIENLKINPDGVYVDATIGGAGHSIGIAKRLSNKGKLIGIDRDEKAIEIAKDRLKKFGNIEYIQDNHNNIKKILKILNIKVVNGILLDLGISSYQIGEKERGFTYIQDGPLDMRMDRTQKLTAEIVVNNYREEDLARVIYEYGEEKFSRRIARNICEYRKKEKIKRTEQLVKIIENSIPNAYKERGHVAKRTFQAIRIEVNDEIKPLHDTVMDSIEILKKGGRLCILTFHSLEDRSVKNAYKEAMGECTCPPGLPRCICNKKKLGMIITKKPILPTEKEIKNNPRSKSAKLRVFERL